MRSSIKNRVVKSQDVSVATPRMVECQEGFQRLEENLSVLTIGDEVLAVNLEWVEDCSPSLKAEEKAALIIEEAEAKAKQILETAEADARRILADAQEETERTRQEVLRTAQDELYPAAQEEGYKAGWETGVEAGEAEAKQLTQKAVELFQLAQRAVQEEYAKVDNELLHLAIKIAERLVRSCIFIEPQLLRGIIQSLTIFPQDREGMRLHISPADVYLLKGEQLPCPWVIDESLSSGDCFLECEEGIFDARIEAQLDKLENALREELAHGGMEPLGSDG